MKNFSGLGNEGREYNKCRDRDTRDIIEALTGSNDLLQDVIKQRAQKGWRRIVYLVGRFDEDHCMQIAGSLTYLSLFALVPLLTVVYTMASAVPAFQGLEVQMQDFIFENLVPETSLELQGYLSEFSQQAKNLTGPGIIFLVVTAILMLRNIEKAFNLIWRTAEHRNAVSSFLLYWAVLSLAPVTIGLALGISTYLSSLSFIMDDLDAIGMSLIGLRLAPMGLEGLRRDAMNDDQWQLWRGVLAAGLSDGGLSKVETVMSCETRMVSFRDGGTTHALAAIRISDSS